MQVELWLQRVLAWASARGLLSCLTWPAHQADTSPALACPTLAPLMHLAHCALRPAAFTTFLRTVQANTPATGAPKRPQSRANTHGPGSLRKRGTGGDAAGVQASGAGSSGACTPSTGSAAALVSAGRERRAGGEAEQRAAGPLQGGALAELSAHVARWRSGQLPSSALLQGLPLQQQLLVMTGANDLFAALLCSAT